MEQRTRIIDIAAAGRTLPATAGASVRRYCLCFNRTIAVATGIQTVQSGFVVKLCVFFACFFGGHFSVDCFRKAQAALLATGRAS